MSSSRARKSEEFRVRRRRRHRAPSRRFLLRTPERLESRNLLAAQPFGAMPDDTAEYMLGDVYVTVVLMESNTNTGPTNNNSENWTASSIAAVKQKVTQGMQWWEDTLADITTKHALNFELDFTHADTPVSTSYEPITRASTDFQFWIYDFLNLVGYNSRGNFHNDIRAFNDAQRTQHNADWAFTIFVVNDEKDLDHQFAPGGFSKAFAFAGGELLVSPASRPASTFSHETGHQFWALDEYRPDGDYDRFRGYYNIQNLNSWDNPTAGFVQEPSIMSNGQVLDAAFADHTSARSTLEMIGWRDSDGDGVFDVLDVPLTLSGSGYYDSAQTEYRFTGSSSVQTLPNRNPSGLKNDISINVVSRAEYRVDGGAWQTAATYGTPEADLDLRISVVPGASTVEIRTIDAVTGITSPVFEGSLGRPAGVLLPGINGVVWQDSDRDGMLDTNEEGIAGVPLQIVDQNGQPVVLRKAIEPDDYASATKLNTISPAVTLSALGSGVTNDTVAAFTATGSSTGANLFASFSNQCGGYCIDWTPETRQLRIDFTNPTSSISLDAAATTIRGYGRLEIYGSDNQLLGRYTTAELASGSKETMTLNRPTSDIKYAIAKGHANTAIRLDNLRFGPTTAANTDQNGVFAIPYLPAGQFRVQVALGLRQTATNPSSGIQSVDLAEGEFQEGVDFGIATDSSRWQNPRNRFDVNNDGAVAPLDALALINSLNRDGTRMLTDNDAVPPYLDVNGDFQIAPLDALQVINELNRLTGSEGEANPGGNGYGESPSYAAGTAEAESRSGAPALDAAGSQLFSSTSIPTSRTHTNSAPRSTRSGGLLASRGGSPDGFGAQAATQQVSESSHSYDRMTRAMRNAEDAELEDILCAIAEDIHSHFGMVE